MGEYSVKGMNYGFVMAGLLAFLGLVLWLRKRELRAKEACEREEFPERFPPPVELILMWSEPGRFRRAFERTFGIGWTRQGGIVLFTLITGPVLLFCVIRGAIVNDPFSKSLQFGLQMGSGLGLTLVFYFWFVWRITRFQVFITVEQVSIFRSSENVHYTGDLTVRVEDVQLIELFDSVELRHRFYRGVGFHLPVGIALIGFPESVSDDQIARAAARLQIPFQKSVLAVDDFICIDGCFIARTEEAAESWVRVPTQE